MGKIDLLCDDFEREYCRRKLSNFIRQAWPQVEPVHPYVHGWHIDAICEHLEAVNSNQINRLYICVPPGCMKSLTVSVFFPAWEWGARDMPHLRYLSTSHAQHLAVRDSLKMRRLIQSDWYQSLWGDSFNLMADQNEKSKFENNHTGFRHSMAFGSLTGSRGDRVLIDDPLSVDDAESDKIRESVNLTFTEAVPSRLNNPEQSAIVVIQQRLHDKDVVGLIEAKNLGYEGLVLPMEFEPDRRCKTSIFIDPRKKEGELLFPKRFTRKIVERDKKILGAYATASQLQQLPVPRGGGMFRREWFGVVGAAPADCRRVRGWDLAATEKVGSADPAYTAGVRIAVDHRGIFYIEHVTRGQLSAHKVEEAIRNTASQDGLDCEVDLPQDPGQAGKSQKRYLLSQLAGYTVYATPETGSKVQRASGLASQAEAGNVKIVRGDWNEDFFTEAEKFPFGTHKDQIDASSRAFARLTIAKRDDGQVSAPMVLAQEKTENEAGIDDFAAPIF